MVLGFTLPNESMELFVHLVDICVYVWLVFEFSGPEGNEKEAKDL